MNMQIKSIILYNSKGQIRQLNFNIGKVNIITGKSSTGKSSIIGILDYCLGRSKFKIPEGKIRDTVAWYAIICQVNGTQILIAKPAPPKTAISQSEAYYKVGKNIEPPTFSKLTPNSNDDAVTEVLSRLIGISPNRNIPPEGQTRQSLEANIKHTKFYLFQEQNVIANRDILFYRQQEPFMPQTIKDTLPYFLGAIQEDRLKLESEFQRAKRELKLVQRELNEAESIVSERATKAESLISEAQQVGLISPEFTPTNFEETIEALEEAQNWSPTTTPLLEDDHITDLRNELQEIRKEYRRKQSQIESAELFVKEEQGYRSEAEQQVLRMESLNLFNSENEKTDICPFCSTELSHSAPTVSAMKTSLINIHKNLKAVERERPRLREYIETLKNEKEDFRDQIVKKEFAIQALVEEQKAADKMQETNTRIARVVGRISLYLETMKLTDETSNLQIKVKKAKDLVEYYEKQLDIDDIEDMKTSILNRISLLMTNLAQELNLEHAEFPYRIDLKKVTVVADRPGRPIPMDRIGSAENHLGCHLISHLSLHNHFISESRPVPGFLVLDQPTQVYFPSRDAYLALEGKSPDELSDAEADIVAVDRLFNLLFGFCDKLYPNLQLIVLEHANLDDPRFQDSLVEPPWTEGRALIPQEWLAS